MTRTGDACRDHHGKPRIPEGTARIRGYVESRRQPKMRQSSHRSLKPRSTPMPPTKPGPAVSPFAADPHMERQIRVGARQVKRLERAGAFVEIERRANVNAAEAWHRVVRQPSVQCHGIARFARLLLKGEDRARAAMATVAEGFVVADEKELVSAVVRRLPLPGSAEVVIAARVLQLAGIIMCVGNSVPLGRCPVLIDIVAVEGRALLTSLIREGTDEWTGLATLA